MGSARTFLLASILARLGENAWVLAMHDLGTSMGEDSANTLGRPIGVNLHSGHSLAERRQARFDRRGRLYSGNTRKMCGDILRQFCLIKEKLGFARPVQDRISEHHG